MSKVDNKEAYVEIDWILDKADLGFFIVIASPRMQHKIAKFYETTSNVAMYNYSLNSTPYSYQTLNEWTETNQDKEIFFILNIQQTFIDDKGFPSQDNMLHFNMSRDLLMNKQKVWIFFMTKEAEKNLSMFAYDFYSYVKQCVHFQDENTDFEDFQPQSLEFDEGGSLAYVKDALDRYQEMKEQYLELPLEGTSDQQLISSATTLTNIAKLYKDSLDYENALSLLERVRIIHERILGEDHRTTTNTYNEIALVLLRQGNFQEALEWYQKSLEISEKILGEDHLVVATMHNNIALVYGRQNDYQKALDQYQKSLEISEKVLGKDNPDALSIYNNIALVHGRQGNYQEALEWFQRALEICEKGLAKDRASTAIIYNNIALVYYGQEDYFKALEWFQKALEISEAILGNDHPSTATIYNNIALVYDKQGDPQKALEWHQLALEICEEALGKNHPTTITIYDNIANIHDRQNNFD